MLKKLRGEESGRLLGAHPSVTASTAELTQLHPQLSPGGNWGHKLSLDVELWASSEARSGREPRRIRTAPAWHESSWDPLGDTGTRLGPSGEGKLRSMEGEVVALEEPRGGGLWGARLSRGDGAEGRGCSGWHWGKGGQHQPPHGDTRSAQVPQGWRNIFPPPYSPPGRDPQDGGTASPTARLWRSQRGSGVLFNPFLPKLPHCNVTPSLLSSKRVPIPRPPCRVSAGTRAPAAPRQPHHRGGGVRAVPQRGRDDFPACHSAVRISPPPHSLCPRPAPLHPPSGQSETQKCFILPRSFFFFSPPSL